MMTSKERAELRARANTLPTTLMIGKEGVSDLVIAEADTQLEARELIKGKVLEAALLTAREACDALCEALNAEGIQCVGNKFVLYRRSERLARQTGTARPKHRVNPVKVGAKRRREQARAERERRNEYFRQSAIEFAKKRRAEERGDD